MATARRLAADLDTPVLLIEAEPFEHKGKFWTVKSPPLMYGFLKPHIAPLQRPHPPIGVAGLSKGSDTLKLAGEHNVRNALAGDDVIPISVQPDGQAEARGVAVGGDDDGRGDGERLAGAPPAGCPQPVPMPAALARYR